MSLYGCNALLEMAISQLKTDPMGYAYIYAILCSVGIIPICCRLLGADLQYFTHENAFSQVNAVARFWPQFSAKLWNDAQPEK